ncbi:glutamine amidotransferase [Paracidobacterium acidisoli]|uniref:Glutamine amidotransferase n=1 Tax=Paracidobacterium acidisoli TaxID=2303751 RepID=A0A372IUP2_9BACT|nr:glutamine amidotransferase [Paracidobacterium acidisoli]MBT9330112.1 glutamine amidotransferase [Paracidobacterium acidisoli]
MRSAVAVTHVPFEDSGSLEIALTQAGYAIETADACTADLRTPSLANADLLIVLGGPIGVYDGEAYPFLDVEIDLIRSRLAEKRPTLGICLGAQLIAAAAGAAVYPGSEGKEIGWGPIHAGPDALLYPEFAELLAPDLHVLHWHGDTFSLPPGASHLAATALYPNQAFAIEQHTLALQFHPEVTVRGLERWYVGHACELAGVGICVPQIRQESEIFAPVLEEAALRFWNGWLSRL